MLFILNFSIGYIYIYNNILPNFNTDDEIQVLKFIPHSPHAISWPDIYYQNQLQEKDTAKKGHRKTPWSSWK